MAIPVRPLLPDDVRTHADHEAMSVAAARHVARLMRRSVRRRGRCTVALAGGSTPHACYRALAATPDVPWNRVYVVWGDERYVPHDHEASNVRMAREALLDDLAFPDGHVHPMPTGRSEPEEAARDYAATLRTVLGGVGAIDLVLLGLGPDGHTASLFPEHLRADLAATRWVKAVEAPARHAAPDRLTLTYAAINRAREAAFLVSGEAKREAVRAVLDREDPDLPATHILPRERLVWFLDEAARG